MILDTNILVAAVDRRHENHPAIRRFMLEEAGPFYVSAVTRVEFFGYHAASSAELAAREKLYEEQAELPLAAPVIGLAAFLRRQRGKVKLGDALVAATALHFDQPLVTHNTRDFRWIDGLSVIDPLSP